VATSIGPVKNVYRLVYEVTLRLVQRALAGVPGIRAVYLRRGGAKGEIVPGVSDLDLAVITEGDPALPGRAYQRWAKRIPFLEQELEVYTPVSLERLVQHPAHRYRWSEAKATWKLLWGTDSLGLIPDWSPELLHSSLYREVKIWFTLFSRYLILDQTLVGDRVFCNSFCFKFLLELRKLELAWFEDRILFSRQEAFAEMEQHPWFDLLSKISGSRFLCNPREVLESTWILATRWLQGFSERLLMHPYGQPEYAFQEIRTSPDVCLMSLFGESAKTVSLSTRPTVAEVHHLAQQSGRHFRTYLLLGHCALSLSLENEASPTVLTASESPEVFRGLSNLGPTPVFWEMCKRRATSLSDEGLSGEVREKRFWASCRLALAVYHARAQGLVALQEPEVLRPELTAIGFPPPSAQDPKVTMYLQTLWRAARTR
jgi:predicted nucleotidyltransferase